MRRCGWVMLTIALATAVPACGQTSDRQLGEALLSTARAAPPPRPLPRCREGADSAADGGDIVVCGADNPGQRLPPTSETDPASRAGLRNGELHPPQLGKGSCRGQFGCFGLGGVSPPAYIIDMKAILEAPKGSDADRIAKGEMAQP